MEQHCRLPKAVIGLGAQQPAPLRIRPQESGRPRRGVAAQDVDGFQQGLGHGRRLDVQRAQHSRRVATETTVACQHMVQRVRRGLVRECSSHGDKVSETLPSGTVRDHRVERFACVPRADQCRPQFGERPERLVDRGRFVPELRFAGTCGFAIRSADDPVVGLHHRVGEKHLPLDGADRENCEATVFREFAQPVGEVAFPLPAQPRDPMRGDIVEEALRKIEAPQMLEAVQQPVGGGGISARLELPEPDEPRHASVDRFVEQMLKVVPKRRRHPLGDAGFDPAFRVDQRVGAKPLDRRRGRQDGSRAPAGIDEPAHQILVRLRSLCFFAEPVAEFTRRAAREGSESVQPA